MSCSTEGIRFLRACKADRAMKIQRHVVAAIVTVLGLGFGPNPSFAEGARTDIQIAYYQQLLSRNPRNSTAYYGLGDALIRKAREIGDPDYFNRAEEALKRSLEIAPNNAGAMRHLAYVFYSRHEFEAAATHARKGIEMDAAGGGAYGILGDALLAVGKCDEGEGEYETMRGRGQ